MRYLLDTAAWANACLIPHVLPQRIRRIVANADEVKGVCSISLLEVAIHHRHGRLLEPPGTLQDFFDRALTGDVELIEITPAVAVASNQLPQGFPGDPFDRTIAATARIMNLTLITSDREIRDARFCDVEFYAFRPGARA